MDYPNPEAGIPLTLAQHRGRTIENVRYALSFTVPADLAQPIAGTASIRLTLSDPTQPLVLDFAPGKSHLASVAVGGKPSNYEAVNDHIVIPVDELAAGEMTIDVAFRAGDAALNRNPEFLYSLFVPARAHLTFPCFDQPDIKARFTLELIGPDGWHAISNGAEVRRDATGGQFRVRFAETQPIPTYLFAFGAGRFDVEQAERDGRTFRMFHRETDAKKVARNRDAIFDLHAQALAWLERYTTIPYPFGKFDFLLVPSFQFGGMEHPGSIFYNATSLFLDESATEAQMLGRASLIAHETSHMWFGDLVTMRWFNDVWMKEVFANFMAAKIVNPAFPRVNHDLRFLVAHYPAAYSVDRSDGTHPIRQPLANLNEAGSLYGPIIYQKAPIVMRQLERLIGAERMQEGLRAYLAEFTFGNATWLDLVRVLDERSTLDLAAWSRAWVEEAGRPSIATDLELDAQGVIRRLAFVHEPTRTSPSYWPQQMQVLVGTASGARTFPVSFSGARAEVPEARGLVRPQFVLPTGGGLAYGGFRLDSATRAFLLDRSGRLPDPVARGAAWVTLWDEMLERRLAPPALLESILAALPLEDTEQNVQLLVGYADDLFWRFLAPGARATSAPHLEATLRRGLSRATTSSLKATYFGALRSTVTSADGIAFLERVWRRQETIPGLVLAEPDEAGMALDLAVRAVPATAAILEEQRRRFTNPDRKARFEFVMPALSGDAAVRDLFFESLRDADNRRREPWVIEGLRYMNHPLRADASRKHLEAALGLLDELRRTGDIFFPKNWMDAVLSGHNTPAAAATVREFLAARADYPVRLRRIILQSADPLFRAAAISQ